MPIRIEVYTQEGILTGQLSWSGHLRDALEGSSELLVERATLVPLDGRPPSTAATVPIVVDDIVLAIPDEAMPGPVHAAWHAISIDAGPYRIEGELATLPGFDPGRALARPTGEFVLLRDIRMELIARPEAGAVSHAQGLVNRYTVDSIESDLMLGFFFPGAHMVIAPGAMVTTAGADAASPSPEAPDAGETGDAPGPATPEPSPAASESAAASPV
jgi:hypothetical protein